MPEPDGAEVELVADGYPGPVTSSHDARRERMRLRRVRSSPTQQPDSAPEKQSELKLNIGIAIVATVLCFFVTGVFVLLHSLAPAIAFAVVGLVCLGILARARHRQRR